MVSCLCAKHVRDGVGSDIPIAYVRPWIPWRGQFAWIKEFERGVLACLLEGEAVRERKEVNFTEDENDEAFGSSIGYPTSRRPCDARRTIDETTLDADVIAWFASSKL